MARLAPDGHHGDVASGCLPKITPPSLALALLIGAFAWPAAAVAASEFPKGDEGYHTYAEVAAEVAAVEAAHPDLVDRFSIGQSHLGRELWAAKVSDNVGVDEAEPEVLFDGGIHADEHMGVEMTLKILHWLVDGYGTDQRITNLVNSREVWLVFLINPDGAEHDIAGGKYHYWRKNRQPTPGSTSKGTDLNRNFGYKWGGGGRTSSNPAAITYRGPKAFSSPGGPGDARLPREPGRRRPTADPDRDHVPRVRSTGDVAIRLHEEERPD